MEKALYEKGCPKEAIKNHEIKLYSQVRCENGCAVHMQTINTQINQERHGDCPVRDFTIWATACVNVY